MPIWKWIILGLVCIIGFPVLRQVLVLFDIVSDAEDDDSYYSRSRIKRE